MRANTDLYRYLVDPAVKGRLLKLKFRTTLQEGLGGVGLILLACSVLGIVYGAYGVCPSRHDYEPHDPDPAIVRDSTCALVFSVILLAGRLCSRNCYLLDPGRGCLIWRNQFLWFRRGFPATAPLQLCPSPARLSQTCFPTLRTLRLPRQRKPVPPGPAASTSGVGAPHREGTANLFDLSRGGVPERALVQLEQRNGLPTARSL